MIPGGSLATTQIDSRGFRLQAEVALGAEVTVR